MSVLQSIIEDLQQVRAYANDMLSHVTDEMWYQQPAPGINPIAWQVGHIAVAQYGLCLKRIRGARDEDGKFIPPSFFDAFGKGSQPASDPAEYPRPDELMRVLAAVHAAVIDETSGLDESVLSESSAPPHKMFATKGGALRFSPKHEMLHIGQIAMLRRLFGGDSLR